MVKVCFYFQVHQPFRLRHYSVFDIGSGDYFDDQKNKEVIKKVAQKCYLPANKKILSLLNTYPEFKVSYSITGTALEQFERDAPEVLDSFKTLAETRQVEFLSETYYHSLSFLYSKEEFYQQVQMHQKKIQQVFKQRPKIFRNTELIYNNELAKEIEKLGYTGVLAEGASHILGWRSPNYVYQAPNTKMKILLKNYQLSDDIAFRFGERSWKEHPLTAEKFAQWVDAINGDGHIVNLFMDYETFGEHQWEDKGIFHFLEALPREIFRTNNGFILPEEAVKINAVGEFDSPNTISWADLERDLSAWTGNMMQQDALKKIYEIEQEIKEIGDQKLIEAWRKLQTSDHFYYMCTKWFSDGDVHKYFNPFDSPYDAFINFMNALSDLKIRIEDNKKTIRAINLNRIKEVQ